MYSGAGRHLVLSMVRLPEPFAGALRDLGSSATARPSRTPRPRGHGAYLLLKNLVTDLIGRSAYVLLTESAATHLEVPLEGTLPVTEQYQHYPTVRAHFLRLPYAHRAVAPSQ